MNSINSSKLGFGTSQIGGPTLFNNVLTGCRPIDRKDALYILQYAFDNGITFYDTSDKYGNAEELLGEAFLKVRDRVTIATKCGITDSGERDFSIDYVNGCIENSLKRLKTDYIDIFQLAKPPVLEVTAEFLSFIEEKIKSGVIKHFGISVIGNDDGFVYLGKENIKSLQIFYNLIFIESEKLIEECRKKDRFVIIRSPLNSGILSGRYTKETKFEKVDARSGFFHGELFEERLNMVRRIAERFSLSNEEVLAFSLNYILSNENVNVVIPAASNIDQLKDYLNIFNNKPRFSVSELNEITLFLKNELNSQFKGQL